MDTNILTDTAPVTVLHGHDSPETAYLIEDYPYSFRLRCKMRVWVETATKGAKKGQQRMVTQTTNPKNGDAWNKPKAGQYAPMVFMYRDAQGHIHADHVSAYSIRPDQHARRILRGIYEQMSDSDRRVYGAFLKMAKRYAQPWQEWDAATRFMSAGYADTGVMPARNANNRIGDGDTTVYLSDEAYEIAAAWVLRQAQR